MSLDPFKDEDDMLPPQKIHIRLRQRNARKTVTTVEDLPIDLDLKLILSHFKKTFSCNGNIITKDDVSIIQLTGDHRNEVSEFLRSQGIATKGNIIIHGY